MVIAGAGGHSLEVLEILTRNGYLKKDILFFDQDPQKKNQSTSEIQVVSEMESIKQHFSNSNFFCLGVGKPESRKYLYDLLSQEGALYFGLRHESAFYSGSTSGDFDAFPFSFIGPETTIGLGVLVNTRAHVHHGSTIGDFSEIGPGAMVLGDAKIGSNCRIGAGAVILPGVELGNGIVVGAGAVVTKSEKSESTLVGVPARKIK